MEEILWDCKLSSQSPTTSNVDNNRYYCDVWQMVIFHFRFYFYTNWNYTIRKRCCFSPSHLINGTVGSSMFLLFCGLKFNKSVVFWLKLFHLWLLEAFLQVGSFVFLNLHLFISTSLLFETTRCSGFILWAPCPVFEPTTSPIFILIFNWRMMLRIHDLVLSL